MPTTERPAPPPTVLVTGASGRVGRAVAVRLWASHRVLGLDLGPSSTTHLVGDLLSLTAPGPAGDALRQALRGASAVVHAAALHAPHVGQVADAAFERVNVEATQRLYALAAEAGVPRFVFTSTTALYGDAAGGTPHAAAWLTEATPPQPRSVYHRSKLAAEAWLTRQALGGGGPGVRILRMSRCFPEPAPWMALYRLHRGIDVRDVAEAHAQALAAGGAAASTHLVSAATPFLPEDAPALAQDAPAVLARRAPALVAEFQRRGWALPRRIGRVVDAAASAQALGWTSRHGADSVWRQLDEGSPEVLPPRPQDGPAPA